MRDRIKSRTSCTFAVLSGARASERGARAREGGRETERERERERESAAGVSASVWLVAAKREAALFLNVSSKETKEDESEDLSCFSRSVLLDLFVCASPLRLLYSYETKRNETLKPLVPGASWREREFWKTSEALSRANKPSSLFFSLEQD